MRSITELAWAAGFFDGEGCTLCRKPKTGYRQLSFEVAQNEISTLRRFESALGFGSISGPYRGSEYQYRACSFEKAQAAIALLWRFLSDPKKIQAKTALIEYLNHINPGKVPA